MSGSPPRWTWQRLLTRFWFDLLYVFVFSAYPVNRWLLWFGLPRRRRLERGFDADFYLAQIASPANRARAARAPLLHYWLIGRFLDRWPNPDFDPKTYRQANPALGEKADFLDHYLRGQGNPPPGEPWAPLEADTPALLALDHARGGGSTRLLGLYLDRAHRNGYRILALKRVVRDTAVFVVQTPTGTRVFDLVNDPAALIQFAREQGVARIVVNHLIDLPDDAGDRIAALADAIGAPYEALLHDYYLACPRIDLIDSQGWFCGLADPEICRSCLRRSGAALATIDPVRWREDSTRYLDRARLAVAPSRDLADRLANLSPGHPIIVSEPESDEVWSRRADPPALGTGDTLRIAILGALNRPKGVDVAIQLARLIRHGELPLSLQVIGPSSDSGTLRSLGVGVHGWYAEHQLAGLIAAANPHVILFPAIWPETWSFTLSAALATRAEIVAFDIGAIADRLRRLGRGQVLPYRLHADPQALADALLAIRTALEGRRNTAP